MKTVVRVAMSLVALAAAALSYQSLTNLGSLCGYGTLSWLYPLVVDLGAGASCVAWLHTRSRQPLALTWALLATSVLLNGTDHYLVSTLLAPSWWLVVGVAAVPPAVLGCVIHLAVGMGSVRETATGATRVPATPPVACLDPNPDESVGHDDELGARRASHQADDVLERARELRAAGMSWRAIAAEVNIPRTTLARELAAVGE